MKALIYVQHLLGTGHVVRAAAIARELVKRGHVVTLASGNVLPPTLDTEGLDVRVMPPVRSRDATFAELVDESGTTIDEVWRDRRARQLYDIYAEVAPDMIVTETFPLGRRQFAFELFPLLEAARSSERPPLIAASVRDILVRKSDAAKELWMADTANRFYDLILVHADPAFVRLDDSFPYTDQISELIRYTGYVHEVRGLATEGPEGTDEVIVSSGGGPVGLELLRSAVKARRRSSAAGDLTWRILVGRSHDEAVFRELRESADDGIVVEYARPDFQTLLSRARLSISQAGYNTVLDVLAARCPAVFVPFEEENETEQLLRAKLLRDRGLCQVLREHKLSGKRLAKAVDRMLDEEAAILSVRMDGAAASADILIQEAERRQ